MRYVMPFALGCALLITPLSARAQDHQHAAPDSAASAQAPQMQMGMMETMGMMGQMMTSMAQMHDMMCGNMMAPSASSSPSDSLSAHPMGMMGEMMATMGRMMTMMSQALPRE